MFRILVAEDDDSARFLMCEVLRRFRYLAELQWQAAGRIQNPAGGAAKCVRHP